MIPDLEETKDFGKREKKMKLTKKRLGWKSSKERIEKLEKKLRRFGLQISLNMNHILISKENTYGNIVKTTTIGKKEKNKTGKVYQIFGD